MKRATLILGMTLVVAGCDRRQEMSPAAGETTPDTRTKPVASLGETAAQAAVPAVSLPGVVTCEPEARLSANVSRLMELADSNGDGRVSKDEATALANFLVGGLLFRADANLDGSVTPEEGRKARSEFLHQNPEVSALLDMVRSSSGTNPFTAVARLLDLDTTTAVTSAEAREIARGAVDDLFRAVDSNSDSAITLAETREAGFRGARAIGRAAFDAADRDDNSRLSLVEFQAAVESPLHAAFKRADADGSASLTLDESTAALNHLVKRLGVPLHITSAAPKP
jgi:hypothetical protein